VVAERQLAGRGRSGREWWQAPRAMFSSLAVPADLRRVCSAMPLMIGLAVRDAVSEIFGVETGLKWPNDLVTVWGKVGGILVEADSEVVVCGCGVNLWWLEPPEGAAGLVPEDPGPDAARSLAESWAGRALLRFESPDWERDEYRQACVTVGSEVAWDPGGTGLAVDVAADGGLVVETVSGRVTLHSGEVRLARPRR